MLTTWSVASFEGAVVGSYHPVPWVFDDNGNVGAGGLWSGKWSASGDSNAVDVSIENGQDDFRVVFVSGGWFVASKGDNLYRLGRRIS
jgi:hypothetical protein